VVLFGSTTENRSRPDSDIDLFVQPLAGVDYWDFIRELEDTVGFLVDVYTDTDDEVFVKKILERGDVIYEI
jgi:predicted nucleotidyltransferase